MIRSGSGLEFVLITPTGMREKSCKSFKETSWEVTEVVQAKDDRLGGHRDADNLMDSERVWRLKKKIQTLRSSDELREKRHQE